MTFSQELASWAFPQSLDLGPVPKAGSEAPVSEKLKLPGHVSKPAIVTFLRHCGCPWAEISFRNMREGAAKNPEIQFIAVSHSDQSSTDKWLEAIGGAGDVNVIVDSNRDLYALWGLGSASFAHLLSPGAFMHMFKVGREDGIGVRPTESGSRWQTSGTWAVDSTGVIQWGGPATRSDDCADVKQAVATLKEST